MSTQTSLIALMDEATKELVARLVNVLSDGCWLHREDLASMLDVSVRSIRDAASHSEGAIISSTRGLKLTCKATVEEVEEATGRFRSQIREMQRRVYEIELAYHQRKIA